MNASETSKVRVQDRVVGQESEEMIHRCTCLKMRQNNVYLKKFENADDAVYVGRKRLMGGSVCTGKSI